MHDFGEMNAHVVGTLMKEAVRRAIVAIRAERFTFEATEKGRVPGGAPDMVTSADRAAQRVYVKLLREWFPAYGIVAEEDSLRVPCTHPACDLWFTVDPLDGTKAFIRRQSHGVGTMLGLVRDGEVIAACVGDIMTQEVYALRPDSDDVFRISEFGVAEHMAVDPDRSLFDQWLLLRGPASAYSPAVQALVDEQSGVFAGYEISGGSIGINIARLWKGEMGGAVIHPGALTPWDMCPLVGISRALGFAFVQEQEGELVEVNLPVEREGGHLERETWGVHGSRVPELLGWWASRNAARIGE